MSCRSLFFASLAAIVFAAAPVFAQNGDQDVPTLTTEMVPPSTVETPEDTGQQPDESGMTPEEKADAARSAKKGEPEQTAPTGDRGPSPAEQAWRQQLSAAESNARDAQARADEAEIQLTNLRNNIGVQSTVDERNALMQQIEQQGAIISQARADAAKAKDELAAVKAEGRMNDYSPDPGPSKTVAGGGANAQYYQQRYDKALSDQTDAERRIQLYQDRVNMARSQLNLNSGSGDAFTQARYTDALNQAESDLAKAQNELAAAQARLQSVVNEAQSAGVSISQP